MRYHGPAVAFPLGGLGTGQVSLAGDGSLTQWEIHNQVNHRGSVPETLFAIRASSEEPPWNARHVLRAVPPTIAADVMAPAPLVTDHEPVAWARTPVGWQPVADTQFDGQYPFARLAFEDPGLTVGISLEAHTPFVPLDADASSLPIVVYRFTVSNHTRARQHGWLVSTLLNTVGWDGVTPIDAGECPLFGGNLNRVLTRDDAVLEMTAPHIAASDPAYGSQAMWTDSPARVLPQARWAGDALRWADSLNLLGPLMHQGPRDRAIRDAVAGSLATMRDHGRPSPDGRSWVGAIAAAFVTEPGEQVDITFVHAWWFPNRTINFEQFGPRPPVAPDDYLGNRYAQPFSGAVDVIDAWLDRRAELEAESRAWANAWTDTSLLESVAETLVAQPALVRSPTIFVTVDGNAYGFEGGLGASTLNWTGDVGGSCPLNCTHVWNYEQALAALFPSLERTMRSTEWDRTQAPDGSIPHRVRLPIDAPQLHGVPIGGPLDPALDGMLGAILKTYRESRILGDRVWLESYWDRMVLLMDHVSGTWDDGTGVLRGRQPVTFDIDLTGPNMFVGSLWLAALRTMATVARHLGHGRDADAYEGRLKAASERYDALLWNGEYYAQAEGGADFDFGEGCLTDQLVGQWWAHQLDLGYLLPRDHVQLALRNIVRYNLRHGFADFVHGFRVFADGNDSGMVICSWPRGGRPEVPVRYADEVWSGSEYQVAAHCLFEGLGEEARTILEAARGRMTGERRNPFNEIECGDHYARAMSGWSLLQASTGFTYDGLTGALKIDPAPGRYPFITGSAWGVAESDGPVVRLNVLHGELVLKAIRVVDRTSGFEASVEPSGGAELLRVAAGRALRMTIADGSPTTSSIEDF